MIRRKAAKPYDVAIVGMACRFPGAADLFEFWKLIQSGRETTREIPSHRWPAATFYDESPTTNDRVACRKGCYLDEPIHFDAASHGVMPLTVEGGEPEQFLILDAARFALEDAGLSFDEIDGRHVDVVIGRGNYFNRGNLTRLQHGRIVEQTLAILDRLHPEWSPADRDAVRADLKSNLPPFGPATIPGQLTNSTAGRVANRFDLLGASYVIDAASASSIVALEQACRSLIEHRSSLAIVGGVYVEADVDFPLVFQQLGALSRSGRSRPFSKHADGLISGEGVGVVILKRLADAERDGDRIYSVIKGIGIASDGRGRSLAAPNPRGHALAIKRAYRNTGIDPSTIGLIEGHGLGLPVSDRAELRAIHHVFPPSRRRVLGAVSAQIGHAMPASGMAGLIKAALCLYHRSFVPDLNADIAHSSLKREDRRAALNAKMRPWIEPSGTVRRAAVNCFGFAGINTHTILEEHTTSADGTLPGAMLEWDTESILLSANSLNELLMHSQQLLVWLKSSPNLLLKDLAYTLNTREHSRVRLGLVVSSYADLIERLEMVIERLADTKKTDIRDGRGTYYWAESIGGPGRVVCMFPGEGSQYEGMLADLCPHFPEVRKLFDTADAIAARSGLTDRPSDILFGENSGELWGAGIAVNVVLSAQWGLYQLLVQLGVKPDAIVGHSSGELLALAASGAIELNDHFVEGLAKLGGELDQISKQGRFADASLLAVASNREKVLKALGDLGDSLEIALDNCAHQIVLAGSPDIVTVSCAHLKTQGFVAEILPFARPYHTKGFTPAVHAIQQFFDSCEFGTSTIPLYSCATSDRMPNDPELVRKLALDQWSQTVEFRRTIERMYDDGYKIFIDVGARGNLMGFVEDTLRGRKFASMAANLPKRSGLTQLNHLVAQLFALGIDLNTRILYSRRRPKPVDLFVPLSTSRPLTVLQLGFPEMNISEALADRLRAKDDIAAVKLPAKIDAGNSLQLNGHHQPSLFPCEMESSSDIVVQSYLETMNVFLETQRDVMSAYLGANTRNFPETKYPFVGEILEFSAHNYVVTRLDVEIPGDTIAEHHTLGGRRVSRLDPEARGLPVVPFAVMAEMIAEVASLVVPDARLIALRDVLAHRWIRYHDEAVILEIHAQCDVFDSHLVRVTITNRGTVSDPRNDQDPIVEGYVLFDDFRPDRPEASDYMLVDGRECVFTAQSVYEEQWLFHGPKLQAVTEIGKIGPRGIEGTLKVLPLTDLCRVESKSEFVLDPIIFDNFTHLLGAWGLDELKQGDVIFPLRLGELRLYGENLPEGSEVLCRITVHDIDRHKIRASAEIVADDGTVWMRIDDWDDWRFYWPSRYRDALRAPDRIFIGEELDLDLPAGLARSVWLEPPGDFAKPVWRDVIEQTMLAPIERDMIIGKQVPEQRRTLRLWGRIAGKEAVRRIWADAGRGFVYPADLAILPDANGKPVFKDLVNTSYDNQPVVSIAHTDGVAVAIASTWPSARIGIDVERIIDRTPGFESLAFDQNERGILDRFENRSEWIARLWCAKETVAKQTGLGLLIGPPSVRILSGSPDGTVEAELAERLAESCPAIGFSRLTVHTQRRDEYIWAWAYFDGASK